MKIYSHSGTTGDLIYSLAIVKKMAKQDVMFKVAIGNIERCIMKYTGRPADVAPEHQGRFTERDFELLLPLLQRQSYIETVGRWYPGDAEPDVDLDHFRSYLYRKFEGNVVEAYHGAFGLPFTQDNYNDTWLEADPVREAAIVVNRTTRYLDPDAEASWRQWAQDANLAVNGVFVGIESEHEHFVNMTGCTIPYRPVRDFLDLANIIAGADLFMGNQSLAYAIAIGLGKDTVLEIHKIKPLQYSECYFPRPNCQYF